MIRVASLGSGSKGNATLIQTATTTLMVDCGFSLRETEKRLAALGLAPTQINGVLVTHEHSDHLKGVAGLANKYDLPVWLSCGTAMHPLAQNIRHPVLINRFLQTIYLGDIEVLPVPVPHDAAEACQFVFSKQSWQVGLLTDLGHISPLVKACYEKVNILLLEFNYDPQMLETGPYPWHLKKRVGGDYGHLSNQQALTLLGSLSSGALKKLVAMHISEKNNCPGRVADLIAPVVAAAGAEFLIADQNSGFSWICADNQAS